MLDPERKAVDTVFLNEIPFVGSQTIIPLNVIGAGNDIDQRQGRQALFVSVLIRMTAVINMSEVSTTLRWFLLLDKMPDQNPISSATVLQDSAIPILSAMNLNNNKRIRVLRTGRIIMRAAPEFPVKEFKLFRPLRFTTRYTSNAVTLANLTSNVLYFCVFSDAPSGLTAPAVRVYSRLRFVG